MFCVHVNDSNAMGVIERKPPSSFSRRSPSGNSGFERFHPPPPLRAILPLCVSYPHQLSIHTAVFLPSRSSLSARLFPIFLHPLCSFSLSPSMISVSLILLIVPLLSSLSCYSHPSVSSSNHYPRRIRRCTHGRLFYPLASSDPQVSSPQRALRQPLFFLLRYFSRPSSFSSFFSSLPPHRFALLPVLPRVLPVPTNGTLAEKKEKSRSKYDPRLSCARGAVWICARSEIRATIRTTRIYRRWWRRRWPRPRAVARVIYIRFDFDRRRGREAESNLRG